ncbi:Glucokinase [uncultured Pleomorphomonas sp.]|uniref:Glucokinase n=2 Tax=Pleomorphomonas TaxID=261933 RepID=A0A2G9WWC5_9HYPH|nr:glucokinase [Pleomorphomonas carboxyditropha]PIO98420.1 glucokinase [Pleomorphomonas carboxyditropha]SCM78182.1 Glucokinase [uncultured Pleomorphomonas sp.]
MSQSVSSVVTFPVLFADIGGTNARFALLTDADGDIRHFDTVETRLFPTVEDAIQSAVIDAGAPAPRSLVFALAGPIGEESTQLTNCPWVVTPKRLIERFRLDHVILFNDFEALGLCLPGLKPKDLVTVGGALPPERGTKVVIGPGTGLGAAGLVDAAGLWVPVPGEGGHIDLAPVTARDYDIWPHIERAGGRVTGETIICGAGLLRLYRAVAAAGKNFPACDTPAAVTAAAEAGDPIAVETVALFAEHLGRIAGNLALTFLAHGGVYLAGGIAPRIVKVLQQGSFRAAFEDKYPHQSLMAALPTAIIVHDRPALAGLVDFARRPSTFGLRLDGRHWRG